METINNNGVKEFPFSDPSIRLVKESDATIIAELFRLNYGKEYAFPEVFDGTWVKRCIYNDGIICMVLEDAGEVIASAALILDYGDYNDQIGELARLVVHPNYTSHGAGHRIIRALFETAEDNVEFAIGETRTAHPHSQRMVEEAGFAAIGFIPHYHMVLGRGESQVIYAKLYGNGQMLRSNAPPQLIPEVVPLARHALNAMGLPSKIKAAEACGPYPAENVCTLRPMDHISLARLSHIKYGRLVEPQIFGGISLDQGYSLIRRRNAVYMVAFNNKQQPVGAIGFQEDKTSRIVKAIELIGKDAGLRGYLCESFLRAAENLDARIIEVNVSAYDPRLQKTFLERGFRPVAYAPAMVFHNTARLDVVKMIKVNDTYAPEGMQLTDKAKEIVSLVENGFVY
ncbi:MAG: GNAT family N-acetyltransferase [Acidobacteriota bacterium]|nr:GNAT family N-acetyltransferase [Acidobacteriota bacterium]